jgi:putative tryptophan/tyrosine transport system substrate-binding protein
MLRLCRRLDHPSALREGRKPYRQFWSIRAHTYSRIRSERFLGVPPRHRPKFKNARVELLNELLPRLARVAVLWNAANPYSANVFKETQRAGRTLGIEVQSLEVRAPDDFDNAFEAARKQRPDAMITIEDPLTVTYRKRIADFATEQQLPSLSGVREFVAAGGLISYGANLADLARRAAGYVDKILKGAKPADLPVQQPTKFDLVINLTTAKGLGLEVPPSLLARADEVFE